MNKDQREIHRKLRIPEHAVGRYKPGLAIPAFEPHGTLAAIFGVNSKVRSQRPKLLSKPYLPDISPCCRE